jgi:hypothetical protein
MKSGMHDDLLRNKNIFSVKYFSTNLDGRGIERTDGFNRISDIPFFLSNFPRPWSAQQELPS